jgi:hypothetical protein
MKNIKRRAREVFKLSYHAGMSIFGLMIVFACGIGVEWSLGIFIGVIWFAGQWFVFWMAKKLIRLARKSSKSHQL